MRLLLLICCVHAPDGRSPSRALEQVSTLLEPRRPLKVSLDVGETLIINFTCMGGPADAIISLSSYREHASPLLFVSARPDEAPSFDQHYSNSFSQWQTDAAGDHFVVAKAVSPQGGVIGLVNLEKFAAEELEGILSLRCSFIVAFDMLFWDHLRSAALCPTGLFLTPTNTLLPSQEPCLGRGTCSAHGVCECNQGWTGTSCEHRLDVHGNPEATGQFQFQVHWGHYQYFRVRVPSNFKGGYLQVEVSSEAPVVVLVSGDELPDIANFDLSNFDDWLNQRSSTDIKFKVSPGHALPAAFRGSSTPGAGLGASISSLSRRLQPEDGGLNMDCMGMVIAPPNDAPGCQTSDFRKCQDFCSICATCTRDNRVDSDCSASCTMCVDVGCIETLASCASNYSCDGPEYDHCDEGCGRCLDCFSPVARRCGDCVCCTGCLPLAAKCGKLQLKRRPYHKFAYVGIYAHRRGAGEAALPSDSINGHASIVLREDLDFLRDNVPQSWVADLYDSFLDLRTLEVTHKRKYPDGEQYIYNVTLLDQEVQHLDVRLYRDRMTLIEVDNVAAGFLTLKFHKEANVMHVLTASTAPKTVFDFDQVVAHDRDVLEIITEERTVWCVLFGAANGRLSVEVWASGEARAAPSSPPLGTAVVVVLCAACALSVLMTAFGGVQSFSQRLGILWALVLFRPAPDFIDEDVVPHESMVSLTRMGSAQGLLGSEVLDQSIEDQFLHRGGIGDDGI